MHSDYNDGKQNHDRISSVGCVRTRTNEHARTHAYADLVLLIRVPFRYTRIYVRNNFIKKLLEDGENLLRFENIFLVQPQL